MEIGHLLLALNVDVEKECLDGSEAEEEAKAHVELLSLEVNILLPDRASFHVTTNALNGAFKYLLNLLVGIGAQECVLLL